MKEINNFIDIIFYAYMNLGLNIKKNKYKKKIHIINVKLLNLFVSHFLLNNIFVIISKFFCDNYSLYKYLFHH